MRAIAAAGKDCLKRRTAGSTMDPPEQKNKQFQIDTPKIIIKVVKAKNVRITGERIKTQYYSEGSIEQTDILIIVRSRTKRMDISLACILKG